MPDKRQIAQRQESTNIASKSLYVAVMFVLLNLIAGCGNDESPRPIPPQTSTASESERYSGPMEISILGLPLGTTIGELKSILPDDVTIQASTGLDGGPIPKIIGSRQSDGFELHFTGTDISPLTEDRLWMLRGAREYPRLGTCTHSSISGFVPWDLKPYFEHFAQIAKEDQPASGQFAFASTRRLLLYSAICKGGMTLVVDYRYFDLDRFRYANPAEVERVIQQYLNAFLQLEAKQSGQGAGGEE